MSAIGVNGVNNVETLPTPMLDYDLENADEVDEITTTVVTE